MRNGGKHFKGAIDDLRIYNYAITNTELATLVTGVANEAIYDMLACLSPYAKSGTCDWDHWSAMAASCHQPNAAISSAIRNNLIDKVKAGQCTSNNWSALHDQFVADWELVGDL